MKRSALNHPTLHSLRRWTHAMSSYYGETEEVLVARIVDYIDECSNCPALLDWDWISVDEQARRASGEKKDTR